MSSHIHFLCERLLAEGAFVRLFLRVRAHVVKEFEEVVEYEAAWLVSIVFPVPTFNDSMMWFLVMTSQEVEESVFFTDTDRFGMPDEQRVEVMSVNDHNSLVGLNIVFFDEFLGEEVLDTPMLQALQELQVLINIILGVLRLLVQAVHVD